MSDPDSNQYCHECKRETVVVVDRAAGDTICSECGLILEDHYIDETSEWRTSANESHENDPVRVGGPIDPLLSDGGISTVISKSDGSRSDRFFELGRVQYRVSTDRSLIQAFAKIGEMADRLSLVTSIKDRANEMYKRLNEKLIKNKNRDAIYAACLYKACKEANAARTIKEICSAARGVTMKDLGRAQKYIDQQLGVQMESIVSIQPSDFVKRFCSNLGLDSSTTKTILQYVEKCEEIDLRRNRTSIVAAVIYMITQQSDNKKTTKDIACATGVSENIIKLVFKEIEAKLSPKPIVNLGIPVNHLSIPRKRRAFSFSMV